MEEAVEARAAQIADTIMATVITAVVMGLAWVAFDVRRTWAFAVITVLVWGWTRTRLPEVAPRPVTLDERVKRRRAAREADERGHCGRAECPACRSRATAQGGA